MVDASNIYGGYLRATRYNSLKDSDLEKVYKRYGGISLASLRKGRPNDAALRRQAVQAVLYRRRPTLKKRGPGVTPKDPTGRHSTNVKPMPKLKISSY